MNLRILLSVALVSYFASDVQASTLKCFLDDGSEGIHLFSILNVDRESIEEQEVQLYWKPNVSDILRVGELDSQILRKLDGRTLYSPAIDRRGMEREYHLHFKSGKYLITFNVFGIKRARIQIVSLKSLQDRYYHQTIREYRLKTCNYVVD